MVKKSVVKEIDRIIKDVWLQNIQKDYLEHYLINEDCLKMAMCYHMRRKMTRLLKENNLRIYTEKHFPELNKRPDIIIAEIKDDYIENSLYDSIHPEDIVALIELKFTGDKSKSTEDWVKDDLRKLRGYASYEGFHCPLYFGVIYEVPCEWLHWFDKRSTNNWAKGRVTELDAGGIGEDIVFEINEY
jgi:hypothetical protein